VGEGLIVSREVSKAELLRLVRFLVEGLDVNTIVGSSNAVTCLSKLESDCASSSTGIQPGVIGGVLIGDVDDSDLKPKSPRLPDKSSGGGEIDLDLDEDVGD